MPLRASSRRENDAELPVTLPGIAAYHHLSCLFQPLWERRMGKTAIRLLTLTVCATALAVASMSRPAGAAPHTAEIEKGKKKVQKGPVANDPRTPSSWPPPMYDDFDRKSSGGGGM